MQTFMKEFREFIPNKKGALISKGKAVDLDTQVNKYAEENNLEILQFQVRYGSGFGESQSPKRIMVLFRQIED
ncbi:hypothetical protein [Fructobacillus papyrifericola]|uniref:Uncharacterized protein n=1 Tax=Fructobacillus papyrifericola TaxID=2713172 RepID=A0ABS5QTZ0_9LACO|nr:hypothetical protein [Fructobacillus papyrifericola]MBS9336668.1 hypothetical protein [Fructobacillus papyrifericola]